MISNLERRYALIAVCAILALSCARLHASDEGYAGSAACKGCHVAEFEAWRGSHHDLAMQHATAETVLGDFDDAEITVHGVTSRFFTRDGSFYVHTEGADGAMADFEIAYTFGVQPLQQYLVPFPDGRMQALGLAWDSRPASEGGQRWFHLYPDEAIGHEDELHWTGRQQNWNYMCADCHSTNYVKGYDIEANRFDSRWSEIDVACEACHGPGGQHVRWAAADANLRAPDVDMGLKILLRDRAGASWQMDALSGIAKREPPLEHRVEVGVCADCHSRRTTIAGGAHADADFLDHHVPAFLAESLYFPDGQIEDEVFVWGSFVQSRMHAAGVICSDCHEPHSLELRAEGDAVCAQCHLPSKFAVAEHHGHSDPAPACVDCHMPERTYMLVDPRRDHSIRIPQPRVTDRFGVPNACNQCHSDESVDWAVAAYSKMYPQAKPPFQDWAGAFTQARSGLPQAESSLLGVAGNPQAPDIARATAMIELAAYLSPRSGQALEDALKDPSPLVRLGALRALEALAPEHRIHFAAPLLTDPLLAVRSEAGRVLAATPPEALDERQRARLRSAVEEYEATQRYNADRPESWLNLGNLHARTGEPEQAERDFRHAIDLAPTFAPAHLNLADLYRDQGREGEASEVLEQGIARIPGDAALHHALGLSRVRGGDRAAALAPLKRAVELAPGEARYAYVYGVGLNSLGRQDEAVQALVAAHGRHPSDVQIIQALALIERDRGNVAAARRWAEEILRLDPADQGARQLLRALPANPE